MNTLNRKLLRYIEDCVHSRRKFKQKLGAVKCRHLSGEHRVYIGVLYNFATVEVNLL
jgi:hypothetical protein